MFDSTAPGSGEVLCERYLAVQRRIAVLQAESSQLLGRIEATNAHLTPDRPAGSVALWVRQGMHCSKQEANRQVRRARALTKLPLVAASLGTGATTVEHVDAAEAMTRLLEQRALSEVEPALVQAVEQADPADIAKLVTHLRNRVDPDGAARDAAEAEARDEVFLSPYGTDGRYAINGTLSATDGAALAAALEPLLKPRGEDDTRTPAQRRSAGLGELARRQLASGDLPASGGFRPQTLVLIPFSTLKDEQDAPGAQVVGGPVLDGATARAYACDSDLTRVIIDDTTPTEPGSSPDAEWKSRLAGLLPEPLAGPSAVLDLGRSKRTATVDLRKALVVRDKGCVRPGCDRPPSWCEVHHLDEWLADHGRTDLDTTALLCNACHHEIHRNNLKLHRDPDGTWHLTHRQPSLVVA